MSQLTYQEKVNQVVQDLRGSCSVSIEEVMSKIEEVFGMEWNLDQKLLRDVFFELGLGRILF